MFGLAIALIVIGVRQGGWWLLALWPAVNFALLGIGHAAGLHGIYGKRAEGVLPFWSWIVFLPLHLMTYAVWRLVCAFSSRPAYQVVVPDLTIGRRLLAHEMPAAFDNYVDLTAEFSEPREVRRLPGYSLVPILDGGAIEPAILRLAIDALRPGTTFIHCAQGVGRTGLFSAALLIRRGVASSPEDALDRLRSARPGIQLNNRQQACLNDFAALVSQNAANEGAPA
jgi:hypothetical protein